MTPGKKIGLTFLLVGLGIAGAAAAATINPRTPVAFFDGHWHDEHGTHGGPAHSGGTDAFGCHNGSVPYHCH
jgi:hypothetical protein